MRDDALTLANDGSGALTGRSPRMARQKSVQPGKLAQLGLIAGSLLFSLILVECVFRLFPQLQVQTGDGEYHFCTPVQRRHQPHPQFGYTEIPGNTYFERYSTLDPWNFVRINKEGFRDNFDGGDKRVLVLGDSMTRGSLVGENQTYTGLLDRWRSDTTFRNYGTGGYGQAHAIRVYADKGKREAHRLVIQQVSLSTDLDDNVESAEMTDNGGVRLTIKPANQVSEASKGMLVRAHLFAWNNSKAYPWFYNVAVRPIFGNWDARRDFDGALELTRRLFVRLAADARANDADLLILVLPGWSEMAGRDDGMAPERQREMLRSMAAEYPGVFLLDATPALKRENPDMTYGVIDKHLTPYGHFLVARAVDRWIAQQWPGGPRTPPPQRRFVPQPAITPDCARAAEYLLLAKQPVQAK